MKQEYTTEEHPPDEVPANANRNQGTPFGSEVQGILDALPFYVMLVDASHRILFANEAMKQHLGVDLAEIVGWYCPKVVHGLDGPFPGCPLEEAVAKGQAVERELYDPASGGWMNSAIYPTRYRTKKGQTVFLHMVHDITEQKRAQDALIQAEKLTIAGRLAASLTHEINNPLQAAIGCLGLAEEKLAEGEDTNRYLEVALDELRRAAGIVGRLRDLHQPSKHAERIAADINLLLERVLTLTRGKCESQKVEVFWRPMDLPQLIIAPDQMQQVFLNILLNALDAMPEGGQLSVITAPTSQPTGVRIAFTDSGVGIPPEVLPHIFEPFYSAKPEGLGLGLFISQSIVITHGGYIEVESQVGQGSVFKVWLPV